MKNIVIPKPNNESLVAQLESLYNVFKNINFGEKLEFDLSLLNWTIPLLILPISAYINKTQSKFIINKCSIKGYLEKMSFPNGVNSISSFQRQIQKYKTFIPISILEKSKKINRERLESTLEEKIYKTLGNVPGARSAVWYPISELITNIFDHSKEDSGFIFVQFYPSKEYLDICIVDCGRGFVKTYKEEKGLEFSDENAILQVMEGHSVKKDPDRGFGVRTSKNMVCKALKGGGFIIISGSCALISVGKEEKLVSLPNFHWQGVIISYRIPKPTGPIDYLKYVV